MIRTYLGPDNGVGAISDWQGAGSTGKGRMKIDQSIPPVSVSVQVDFVKHFAACNLNRFTFEPTPAEVQVTWSIDGANHYIMKLMSVFINMDRSMGKHFETGLANLKQVSEK